MDHYLCLGLVLIMSLSWCRVEVLLNMYMYSVSKAKDIHHINTLKG